MSPWRLLDSPIRYMQARAAFGPPRLFSALPPVILNAGLIGVTTLVSQSRMSLMAPGLSEPVSGTGLLPVPVAIIVSIVMGLLGLAVHAGTVIVLDMVTAQSRQPRRFLELCALAYWPQVFVSIPILAATWLYFDPPVMAFRLGGDALVAAMDYAEEVARMPFSILTTQVKQFAALWLIALHACTLRVVSGLTIGGTWSAGIALAAVFIGVPWFAGQIMERLFF